MCLEAAGVWLRTSAPRVRSRQCARVRGGGRQRLAARCAVRAAMGTTWSTDGAAPAADGEAAQSAQGAGAAPDSAERSAPAPAATPSPAAPAPAPSPAAPAPSTPPVKKAEQPKPADKPAAAVAATKGAAAPLGGSAALLAKMRAQKAASAASAAPGGASAGTPAGAPVALTGSAAILAKMRAQKAASAPKPEAKPMPTFFLYGSQTGTCEEIAKNLAGEAASRGVNVGGGTAMEMNALKMPDLAVQAGAIVVVVSSTGDGDAPDNCANAVQKLKGTKLGPELFAGVPFTTLGLGDSNYTKFMEVPRVVRRRLEHYGGKHFYPSAEADEVDGIEGIVEAWTEGLWEPLKKVLAERSTNATTPAGGAGGKSAAKPGKPAVAVKAPLKWLDAAEAKAARAAQAEARAAAVAAVAGDGKYSKSAPLAALVSAKRDLTSDASHADGRRVVHMEISAPEGSTLAARPGDSLGLLPANDPALVERLLARLGVEADKEFSAGEAYPACTAREALSRRLEICGAVRKSTAKTLALFCTDAAEGADMQALVGDKARFRTEVTDARCDLLALLERFPSCAPPLAVVLEAVPALAPRYYSLCNDPQVAEDGACHVAFSIVEGGVATNYLDGLVAGEATVEVFVNSGGAFAHPDDDLAAPLVMIGPGTGVAPFRGFLQRRAKLAEEKGVEPGPAWLFFGCRRRDHDFLYGKHALCVRVPSQCGVRTGGARECWLRASARACG